jgi:hypothetical protein
MNRMELLHPPPESYRSRGFVIAVPPSQARDDPACPGEASWRVRVLLPLGVSLQRWDERFEGFDFRLREDGRSGQLMLAIAFLYQLNINAGGFYRRCGELHQSVGGRQLAVLQLQPLGFCHPEQLLDDPASLLPADNLPSLFSIRDIMCGQQTPV